MDIFPDDSGREPQFTNRNLKYCTHCANKGTDYVQQKMHSGTTSTQRSKIMGLFCGKKSRWAVYSVKSNHWLKTSSN